MLPTSAPTDISGKLLGAECDVPVVLVPNRAAYVCFSKYHCLQVSQTVTDLGWMHSQPVLHSHLVRHMNQSRMIARHWSHSGNSFDSNRLVKPRHC